MRFFSNPGEPEKVVRSIKIEEDGRTTVYEVGTENLQEYINSHKDETSLVSVLKRFSLGDESALHARPEFYGDFTHMPTTLAEVMQRVIDANKAFEALPADIRGKFDYDVNKFIAASESPDFLDILGVNTQPADSGVDPVSE